MARYIKAVECAEIISKKLNIPLGDLVDIFAEIPTADVAREIFEEIETEITEALKSNYKVLPEIEASDELYHCVHGKISALCGIDGFIEELKKKYTEGEQRND